jgi:Helix-turn-helix domain
VTCRKRRAPRGALHAADVTFTLIVGSQKEESPRWDNSAGPNRPSTAHRKEPNVNAHTKLPNAAQAPNAFEIARDVFLRPIKRDRKLPRNAFIVADEIAQFFNRKHFEAIGELLAWPSIITLVSLTGLSRRTIIRMIGALEAAGYIAVETSRGRGKNNRYRGQKKVSDVSPFSDLQKVSDSATKGVKLGAEKVPHVAPDSLRRPPERPSEGRESPLPPLRH